MFDEANALRTIIDAIPAGDPHPDETKLVEVEDYFRPTSWLIYTEDDLTNLFNTMNSSAEPLVICGEFAADITTSKAYTLQKGTLTLLGNGHSVALGVSNQTSACLAVSNSATLNPGDKKDNSKNDFYVTSSSGFGSILYSTDTATLNICDGVTIGDACGRAFPAGINITSSGTVNMYGGTLKNLYHDSTADCAEGCSVERRRYNIPTDVCDRHGTI